VARISTKNQITIPVAALDEVGLHAGERVTVEPAGDGQLRIRRATTTFEDAFGTLTGTYPAGYLEQLDAEDARSEVAGCASAIGVGTVSCLVARRARSRRHSR
jgi:AbrB family looped-hinge helix DNA binding protein